MGINYKTHGTCVTLEFAVWRKRIYAAVAVANAARIITPIYYRTKALNIANLRLHIIAYGNYTFDNIRDKHKLWRFRG